MTYCETQANDTFKEEFCEAHGTGETKMISFLKYFFIDANYFKRKSFERSMRSLRKLTDKELIFLCKNHEKLQEGAKHAFIVNLAYRLEKIGREV